MSQERTIPYLPLQKINNRYASDIKQAINEVVDSGWYLRGQQTQLLEQEYAEYIGTRYCVACGNGLDALTLILRAYKELGVLHDGDEVMVPANTYIASILAITENNLTPVLMEPRIDTFQMDDTLIEERITPKTRAVMLVHLYGRCAYTERIAQLCDKYQLLLIEDNAQAHGAHFPSSISHFPFKKTGSLGHAAGHSFYPGKNLGALGDGGAVTTNDKQLAEIIRALGNYGSSKKYHFDYLGKNSRMDEIQAAVLRVKLRHLDEDNGRRQDIALRYIREINNPQLRLPSEEFVRNSVHHIFPVLCEERNHLQEFLLNNGVETIIHYPIPPHRQPCYAEWNNLCLPVTDRIHRQELSIPLHPLLSNEDISRIILLMNAFE